MVITTCLTANVLINNDVSLYLCVSEEKAFYSTCDINQRYIVMQKCKNLNRPLFFRFFRKRLFKRLFSSSVHVFFPSPSFRFKEILLFSHSYLPKQISPFKTRHNSNLRILCLKNISTYLFPFVRLPLSPLLHPSLPQPICNTFCCS